MKKVIAIVAGGDSSEHDVSLRSAAGIDSWIDKEKYDVYIVEVSHQGWMAHLPNGKKSAVYRHNFTFKDEWGRDIRPDYAYITIHGTQERMVRCRAISTCLVFLIQRVVCWWNL